MSYLRAFASGLFTICGGLLYFALLISGLAVYAWTLGGGYLLAGWLGVFLAAVTPGVSSVVVLVLLWIRFGSAPWIYIGVLLVPFVLSLTIALVARVGRIFEHA